MKAHKCDRCGKFYEAYLLYRPNIRSRLIKKEFIPETGANGIWTGDTARPGSMVGLDLCPDCLNQLLEWLSQV